MKKNRIYRYSLSKYRKKKNKMIIILIILLILLCGISGLMLFIKYNGLKPQAVYSQSAVYERG